MTNNYITMTIATGSKYILHTEREIKGQPNLWKEVFDFLKREEQIITSFLSPLFQKKNLEIILSGAGSAAFVGEAAQGLVQKNTGCTTRAIATTDLVTHPELFCQKNTPTLLVSFARSGNSPESLETVRLANEFCDEIYHLIITCNSEGELHKYASEKSSNSLSLLLPQAANDKSLAMTGSFTSMLLSILLVGRRQSLTDKQEEIKLIVKQAEAILQQQSRLMDIAKRDFERVVFLGSGTMLAIARECHLKLQELTDGQVICKHDSFLGFRHGPRAVVNNRTLIVYFFSQDDHVYKYEQDLALSIAKDPRKISVISIGREYSKEIDPLLNIDLDLNPSQELNNIPATLIGQLLGFYRSLELGLNPDNPSVSGSISRVVQGVTIYEYTKEEK